MEQIQLEAVLRKKEEIGKKFLGQLRRDGLVPAVVYKRGHKTEEVAVNARVFNKILHTSAGGNVLIELKVPGEKSKTVIIKEIQHHPYKDDILHVDFNQIALDEVIKVKVPVVTVGEAAGVTRDGGILERMVWEIEIECLPTQIPEKVEINVADLEVGHTKTIKDLVVPQGIKVLHDSGLIVVSVSAKKSVEEIVAVPEGETAEPEVLREKKPVEGEEAAAEAPAEEKKPKEEKK